MVVSDVSSDSIPTEVVTQMECTLEVIVLCIVVSPDSPFFSSIVAALKGIQRYLVRSVLSAPKGQNLFGYELPMTQDTWV